MEGERFLLSEGKSLSHYGMLERSGRYPWGSGENPFQRLKDWQGYVWQLRKSGLNDEEIAKTTGMTVEELHESMISTTTKRSMTTIRKAEQTVANVAEAQRLKDKGYSNVAIAERMGISEGSVRNLLKPGADSRAKELMNIADGFKNAVDEKGIIDIGGGIERHLGISRTRMNACIELLKEEGYNVYKTKVRQIGTGEFTNIIALAPPGMSYKEFMQAYNKDPSIVKMPGFYSDGGDTVTKIKPPVDMARDRIMVRYDEEGGSERDGVLQIRRGVEDLYMGDNLYAQVRVSVDGKMYMKGMAVYGDDKDFPPGIDVIYNSNKAKGTPDEKVFKPMKVGEEDPFGAIVYQKEYVGKDGKTHTSVLNMVNEEGAWEDWSKSLASQFLSKQKPAVAEGQLKLAYDSKKDEFDEIDSLTNPTIKKKLMVEFADDCDSAAVHLKAAALPRQKTQVILPVPSLADDEIYAPNFRPGETVVLVRYPHAGPFESPELRVNNKNPEAKRMIGKGLDAVGINKKVADQLSGADFDGDNVIVIPNNDGRITSSKDPKYQGSAAKALRELRDFNPKVYKLPPDSPELKRTEAQRTLTKNQQMGRVSNLITDMTIRGADADEIARAVKHSMVVIDSVKHDLDWKQSEKDNGIAELKAKYQGGANRGASTIISRAKSTAYVHKRKEITSPRYMTDEEKARWEKGEKIYRDTGETYDKYKKLPDGSYKLIKSGVTRTQKSTKMYEAKDARELSSGTAIEEIYAKHANDLKALANKARSIARSTPRLEQSPSAKETYKAEVESLDRKLDVAMRHRPVERQVQLVANAKVKAVLATNPDMKENKDQVKKLNNKALKEARERFGSKDLVEINDREWEAIQAGAISDNKLQDILKHTDVDKLKQRATPRSTTGLTDAQASRAKAMIKNGLTQAEVADALGVSVSTISNVVKENR